MPRYPLVRPNFLTNNSVLATGYQLFFYTAGTTTKQNTYTTAALTTANPNPILLNARGEPDNSGTPIDIFLIDGASYKVVLATDTDTDPPGSPIWTVDNVTDTNPVVEYINSTAAVRVNATTYTVTGNQTGTFIVGQRVKLTGGADRYARIATSVYTTLTTLTVVDTKDALGNTQTLHASMDTALSHITTPNGIRGLVLAEGSADASGTVDGITATYYPAIVLSDDVVVMVRAAGANTVTTPTFAPDGAVAKTIVKDNNAALVAGNIAGADHMLLLQYNAGADNWHLLNPASNPSASIQATETTLGIAEIATQVETDAGTDDLRFITPLKLDTKPAGGGTVGQAGLKTATGSSSVSVPANSFLSITLTGGTYSWWTASAQNAGDGGVLKGIEFGDNDRLPSVIGLANSHTTIAQIFYIDERYVQASPPYQLDDIVPAFIYGLVDNNNGDILGASAARDPPWAYSGYTNIQSINGRRKEKQWRVDLYNGTGPNPYALLQTGRYTEAMTIFANNELIDLAVTNDLKNRDMHYHAHPFDRRYLKNKTVIMLDPLSPLCADLGRLIEDEYLGIPGLLTSRDLRFKTSPLTRIMPNGVIAVTPYWR